MEMMDIDNLREDQMPGQVIGGDWRSQLPKDSRQRIVNKIMETLKRRLPFPGHEGLQELKKIAVRFEEKNYTTATSQSDYLRKISLKMVTMEPKYQNPMANSLQSNAASNNKNPQDSGGWLMDSNNWRTEQGQVQIPGQVIGGEAVPTGGMEGGDWRTQLQQDSRQRIVNKIMETLKRCLPFPGHEGLQELKKIAVRFEERIYSEATSQSDYLRKISLKMLAMETKYPNPMANSLQSNAASNNKNPQDTASLDSSSQIGSAADEDWQEGIYQKIKSMHEMYYPELNELYQRMAAKLQQYDALPRQPGNESLDKLRFLTLMMERLIKFLQTNKNDIQPDHEAKIAVFGKQIENVLKSNRPRKAVSSMQQEQSNDNYLQTISSILQPQEY